MSYDNPAVSEKPPYPPAPRGRRDAPAHLGPAGSRLSLSSFSLRPTAAQDERERGVEKESERIPPRVVWHPQTKKARHP